MAEKKNAKYFVMSDKPNLEFPAFRPKVNSDLFRKIVHLDADVVPDSEFYSEAMWIVPGDEFKEGVTQVEAHSHTWGEFIGFYGYNYDDIHDLGAEIEFTIDGETHHITESFASFIPAGIEHGPLIIRNVVRPIMHFMAGTTKKYE
jgi:hypothetical protein